MYEDQLKSVELFGDLDPKELKLLAKTCTERQYPVNAVLMKEGEAGAGLFILVEGKVRVTQTDGPNRPQRELTVLGAGEVIGEMSLLDDLPRSATVTTLEPSRCLLMSVWDFRASLRESPDIAIKLLAELSRRLRKTEQLLHHK
ncbi:MAG TPA: cyclic nucleotide-binding domain-containing protein [Ktedonobacterales bacterium]|jgi:CRP-like cAMP-binding protein